jgi:hypothetical protein
MDPPTMNWWMLIAIVVAAVRIVDAAEPEEPATLDLQMRTEVRVPAYVLKKSQDEVTRIFAGAGLAVRWTETSPRVTVKIVALVLGYDRRASGVMGVAQRTPNGYMAQIFFRQVQDFAYTYEVDLGTMLGHVIAHEIGHLLLPVNAHSPAGVMQPYWDRALVRDAVQGLLTFTEAQAARIRASR